MEVNPRLQILLKLVIPLHLLAQRELQEDLEAIPRVFGVREDMEEVRKLREDE